MKARVGDHIVLATVHPDGPTRSGRVVALGDADGGPPYVVRWDDGEVGSLYPGRGAVLSIGDRAPQAEAPPRAVPLDALPGAIAQAMREAPGVAGSAPPVREWSVRIAIVEAGDDTSATVMLISDAPTPLTARGSAHRMAQDPAVPQIGDEVAVARALRHLADRLVDTVG